jgi:soluble lytic murein transglycosylase
MTAIKHFFFRNRLLIVLALISVLLACCDRVRAGEIEDLIPFIIKAESNGNPNAVSNKGCIGLMQINPKGALAEWNKYWEKDARYLKIIPKNYVNQYYACPHNIGDLYDPSINVKIGTWYLRRLKDHYIPKNKYSVELLLASYNMGPTRMRKLNWDISKAPKETRNYVKRVMGIWW